MCSRWYALDAVYKNKICYLLQSQIRHRALASCISVARQDFYCWNSPFHSCSMSFSSLLSFLSLFVCSDQLTGIDMAAEAIRWPPVKQWTRGWLACQQWCGHTALWRQRYERQHKQTRVSKTARLMFHIISDIFLKPHQIQKRMYWL